MLDDFPVVIDVPVAWGEMDAFGHVNNLVYFRYFESARIAYFERIGFMEVLKERGIGPILASTRCRFRKPLTYPDQIHVGAKAVDVTNDRFTMLYAVESESLGAIAADGEGLIVAYDYNALAKATLPSTIRQRIDELESDTSS